jgi:hypothetical protein
MRLPANPAEAKRLSALVSRKLRLLRAHGILHKIKGRRSAKPAGRF